MKRCIISGKVVDRNPGGPGVWSVSFLEDGDVPTLTDEGRFKERPDCTNLLMEYVAAANAILIHLERYPEDPSLIIQTKSAHLVSQMLGKWKMQSGASSKIKERIESLIKTFDLDVTWSKIA